MPLQCIIAIFTMQEAIQKLKKVTDISWGVDLLKHWFEKNNMIELLRIDTSGGSVNCSAPFEKGWMIGSL